MFILKPWSLFQTIQSFLKSVNLCYIIVSSRQYYIYLLIYVYMYKRVFNVILQYFPPLGDGYYKDQSIYFWPIYSKEGFQVIQVLNLVISLYYLSGFIFYSISYIIWFLFINLTAFKYFSTFWQIYQLPGILFF